MKYPICPICGSEETAHRITTGKCICFACKHVWVSKNLAEGNPFRLPFIESFTQMGGYIHQVAKAKGWWSKPRTFGDCVCLVHSELSEALEGFRMGNPPDQHIPDFQSIEVELADAVIRVMDLCQNNEYRLAQAIVAKCDYNESRPYRHGGKSL